MQCHICFAIIDLNFNQKRLLLKCTFSDTRPFVDRVLKGEKPGAKKQAANNKSGPYNAKTATNNAKNKLE